MISGSHYLLTHWVLFSQVALHHDVSDVLILFAFPSKKTSSLAAQTSWNLERLLHAGPSVSAKTNASAGSQQRPQPVSVTCKYGARERCSQAERGEGAALATGPPTQPGLAFSSSPESSSFRFSPFSAFDLCISLKWKEKESFVVAQFSFSI